MSQRGFTLIELVTVMVIVSIIGLTAFSRLNDTQSFTYAANQERLISALRIVQNKAMQDTRSAICYQVNFQLPDPAAGVQAGYGFPTADFSLANAANTCDEDTIDFTVYPEIAGQTAELAADGMTLITADGLDLGYKSITFDSLGRPSNSENSCATTCKISFDTAGKYGVCVNVEGMIYAC